MMWGKTRSARLGRVIQAVADYVLAHIKGAGEPTYAQCVDFFSSGSRVCDIYKPKEDKTDTTANVGKSQ